MQVFALSFQVLSVSGVWLPVHWESSFLIFCYRLFSLLMIFVSFAVCLLQMVLMATVDQLDLKVFNEMLFTLLPFVSVCSKAANMLFKRRNIIQLAEMLKESCCLPRDDEEKTIQKNCDKFIRQYTIAVNVMAQSTVACYLLLSLLQNRGEQRKLLLPVWLPYDTGRGHEPSFWFTYGCEVLALVLGSFLNITLDVVINGFMHQACTQLDILKHRLSDLPEKVSLAKERQEEYRSIRGLENDTLRQAVRHHNYIMQYASKINDTFEDVIVGQFFASSLILSVLIFELSKGNVAALQYVMDVCYLTCMLAQFFSYCWFGNEITLKSMDFGLDIYAIDWTQLSVPANRTLLVIMLRTTKPVVMSCAHFLVLGVESFKSILKVSYSSFNFLKESTS